MIKARTMLILAGVTLAIVVAAVVSSSMRRYDTSDTGADKPLLPDLEANINKVAEIRIVAADDKTIDLKRKDDAWVDASRGGYPARFEPVKQLLVSLAQAKIAATKTSNPEAYDRLGVGAPTAPGSKATQVTLLDDAGKTLASVTLGQEMPGGQGNFVRVDDDKQVLLTADRVSASALPLTWLEREVMRIPRDDVQRATIARPDGTTFSVVRTEANTFDMIGVPEGRQVRGQSPMASIVGALAYVDFMDVKPAADLDADSLRPPLLATYETKDGMEINVSVWTVENDKWTTFTVSKIGGSTDAAPPSDAAPESPEPKADAGATADAANPAAKPTKDDATKPETVDEKVARLKKKLDGWAFKLSPSTVVPLETSMDELTQVIPAPDQGPPAPPTGMSQPQPPRPQAQPGGAGG